MKKFFPIIALFAPVVTFAHVKWFAEEEHYVRSYSLYDEPVLIWIAGAILLVFIGIYLERKLKLPVKLEEGLDTFGPKAMSLASIGLGVALIIFSLSGFLFAPNLDNTGSLLLILEGVSGIMILFGLFERIGALLLILAFIVGIGKYGAIEMMDAIEILGFALYVLIVGRPKWKITSFFNVDNFWDKFKVYAVPILRIGLGLNLMVLAFSEKIFASSLTDNFLLNYNWNFMEVFGMSNYWFAFSAGMAEFLFGLFLVLGLVTRMTTLFLAGFLITTLFLLGPIELVGHLPHFSIAIVLLVIGSGDKLKLRV